MKRLNQKGMGIAEVLLILVIVGLVGFVGWYVLQSKNKNSSSTTNTPTTPTQTEAHQQKYLKVPELGVEFVVPDSIPTLTYVTRKSYDAQTKDGKKTTVEYVVLTTPDNKDKDAVATCGPEGQEWLGSLVVTEPNTLTGSIREITWEEFAAESEYNPGKELGDKFYAYETTHVCDRMYTESQRNDLRKSVKETLKLI